MLALAWQGVTLACANLEAALVRQNLDYKRWAGDYTQSKVPGDTYRGGTPLTASMGMFSALGAVKSSALALSGTDAPTKFRVAAYIQIVERHRG